MRVNKQVDVESLTVYTRTNAPDLKPLSTRFSYIHCKQAEWCQSPVTYQTFLREQSEREERVWLICAGCSSEHDGMLYVGIISCDAACTAQALCNSSSCPSLVDNIANLQCTIHFSFQRFDKGLQWSQIISRLKLLFTWSFQQLPMWQETCLMTAL